MADNNALDPDEFIMNSVEALNNELESKARKTQTRAMIDSVNQFLALSRTRTDNRCAFVGARDGKRCDDCKGKFRKDGRWISSIYCTTGKNHRAYMKQRERQRQNPRPRTAGRPTNGRQRTQAEPVPEDDDLSDFVVSDNEEDELSDLDVAEEDVPPSPQRAVPQRPIPQRAVPQRPIPQRVVPQTSPRVVEVTTPRISHARMQEIEANARMEDTCIICLDRLGSDRTEYRALDCGHIFHRTCIDSWMATSRTCPICRSRTRAIQALPPVIDLTNDVPMPDAPSANPVDSIDQIIYDEIFSSP